tara:strand:+ start:170 stop:1033 length:864 start_codon:yes stop_codon:yes gene_type:complete
MNSLEISFIGSACGKNKFEPRNKVMLLLLCREYKDVYKKILFENGSFVLQDPNKKTYNTELKRLYSEYKKDVKSPDDFKNVESEIKKRLKTENEDIKEEDLKHASNFLKNSLKKDCGINNETSVINEMNYKKGNNTMYYYSENGWTIKGLHDAMIGNIVIEIKTRMKPQNVRKNAYDLYQLFGYLLAMSKTVGKIVQKYNSCIYDSDIETDSEYGIIDITIEPWKDKFETFKKELNDFFFEIRTYSDKLFDVKSVIQDNEHPIASFNSHGVPCDINPKYEKIVKTLT